MGTSSLNYAEIMQFAVDMQSTNYRELSRKYGISDSSARRHIAWINEYGAEEHAKRIGAKKPAYEGTERNSIGVAGIGNVNADVPTVNHLHAD